jgi:hypothetical protein
MDRSHLFRKAKLNTVVYTENNDNSDDELYDDLFSTLEVFDEHGMGKGVRTVIRVEARSILGEYTGKIINGTQASIRMNGNPCHYVVATSYYNRFIDGEGVLGNILKYVNHKCRDNNCRLIKLTNGRVGLETTRVIYPGESLNYNYRHLYFQGHEFKRTKCLCSIDCPNYF